MVHRRAETHFNIHGFARAVRTWRKGDRNVLKDLSKKLIKVEKREKTLEGNGKCRIEMLKWTSACSTLFKFWIGSRNLFKSHCPKNLSQTKMCWAFVWYYISKDLILILRISSVLRNYLTLGPRDRNEGQNNRVRTTVLFKWDFCILCHK